MVHWQPNLVVIITPKGTVLVPRRLYAYVEARMQPNDLGLLRDHDWWVHLSELIHGIQFTPPVQHKEA